MKHSISLTRLSESLRKTSAKLLQKVKSTYPDYYHELINARMTRTLSMSTITTPEVQTDDNFATNLLDTKNKTSSSLQLQNT
ncbi:unnamed protein product [Oppiella nova]|uniref:Uncharacterized protein n=1 Tax=Oppiella nova TaxID=334625 RepID=A0A7R9LRZ6_9ACAR|nr:unnamed protein product [Oppiella nova]CAG2166395.1 unnamed protein product [Oppiella nova]